MIFYPAYPAACDPAYPVFKFAFLRMYAYPVFKFAFLRTYAYPVFKFAIVYLSLDEYLGLD